MNEPTARPAHPSADETLVGHLVRQEIGITTTGYADDIDASPFTWGLVMAVVDALEYHGYQRGDDQHVGRAVTLLRELAETFAGYHD